MVLLELLLAAAAAAVLLLLPPAAAASFCCCCCLELLPLLLPAAAAAAALFLHWGYDWLKSKECRVAGKEKIANALINAVVPRDATWSTRMKPNGSVIERIYISFCFARFTLFWQFQFIKNKFKNKTFFILKFEDFNISKVIICKILLTNRSL